MQKKNRPNIALAATACALAACAVYLLWLPDVQEYASVAPKTTAYIELRRAQAAAKGRKFAPRMSWRGLDGISPHLVHAVIIAEDEAFYRHHGIDWKEMESALKKDWEKKRFAYGGSTITQQLSRNLYLSPSKNPLRKLKEAIIARSLEKRLGKRRILELYLNVAEWGNGIFGAEAAASAYFGKSAAELSPDEAVALASILPSPRRWSPFSAGGRMLSRRGSILARMRRSGYLTDEAAADIDAGEAGSGPAPEVAVGTATAAAPVTEQSVMVSTP